MFVKKAKYNKLLEENSYLKNNFIEKSEVELQYNKLLEENSYLKNNFIEKSEVELQYNKLLSENSYLKINFIENSEFNHKEIILIEEYQRKINEKNKELINYHKEIQMIERELKNQEKIKNEYRALKKSLIESRNEYKLQEIGFYKNIYPFTTTEQYKKKLENIYLAQKTRIRHEQAADINTSWTVNDSIVEGRKMTKSNVKAMLRSYNIECDNAISSLKYGNIYKVIERIEKSYETLNRLNSIHAININEHFHKLKIKEAYLVYEKSILQQEEKETLKALKEDERERKKVEKEIKEKMKELDIREIEINKELNTANKLYVHTEDGEKISLLDKIKRLELELERIEKMKEEVIERELIGKSGYVYIISNKGTLGENIYKIGMTRRLEPLDRIKELSGASVPFEYDIHAMILTDDAPKLENCLHQIFSDKRVNMINKRKEFFDVTLDEIKSEVFKIIGRDVVFTDNASAVQYYQTLNIKQSILINSESVNSL